MHNEKDNKWGRNWVTIKVTNRVCGRVDYHRITKDEIGWIDLNPNLEVEIIEYKLGRNKKKDSDV